MSKTTTLQFKFWGVRGTLPVPGRRTLQFGGNTSCITVTLPNDELIIFDAGSGIKNLGDHLANTGQKIKAKLFISHTHWDHINGLPFFSPLYQAGNDIQIYGPRNANISIKDAISGQMDSIYFPITIDELAAKVSFHDLDQETRDFTSHNMSSHLLNHPGNCLGYRLDVGGLIFCYVTDQELSKEFVGSASYTQLVDFIKGANVLITDTTYTNAEYPQKIGWGHSSTDQVAILAHDAGVEQLLLFHHDPGQCDDAIAAKQAEAQATLNRLKSTVSCVLPAESETFALGVNALAKKVA